MSRPVLRARPPVVPLAPWREPLTGPFAAGRGPLGRPGPFEMACACVADNDNRRPARTEERLLIGVAVVAPMLASLGMVALMYGLSG